MRRLTEELRKALAGLEEEGPHPLSHPRRREVLYTISGHPCSTSGGIARRVGISTKNAQWHLRSLMNMEIVETYVGRGNRVRYYTPQSLPAEDRPIFEALQLRSVRWALKLLMETDTLVSSDIREIRRRASVYRGLSTLLKLGLVNRTGSGKLSGYWLSEVYFVKREVYRNRMGDVARGFVEVLGKSGLKVVSTEIVGNDLIVVVERGGRFSVNLVVNPFENVMEEIKNEGDRGDEEEGG